MVAGSKKHVIRCADCGCSPEECRKSKSPNECPNCRLGRCCCWPLLHESN